MLARETFQCLRLDSTWPPDSSCNPAALAAAAAILHSSSGGSSSSARCALSSTAVTTEAQVEAVATATARAWPPESSRNPAAVAVAVAAATVAAAAGLLASAQLALQKHTWKQQRQHLTAIGRLIAAAILQQWRQQPRFCGSMAAVPAATVAAVSGLPAAAQAHHGMRQQQQQ